MNNDMTTLILASKNIFQRWNDKVSDELNNGLVVPLQNKWNSYNDEMNVRMKILMNAEAEMQTYVKQFKDNYR
jgi:hypothetical protein